MTAHPISPYRRRQLEDMSDTEIKALPKHILSQNGKDLFLSIVPKWERKQNG